MLGEILHCYPFQLGEILLDPVADRPFTGRNSAITGRNSAMFGEKFCTLLQLAEQHPGTRIQEQVQNGSDNLFSLLRHISGLIMRLNLYPLIPTKAPTFNRLKGHYRSI